MGGTYRAPDFASANREAVLAQAETFPLLRQIEAASRIGAKVSVPVYKDGKATSEFKEVDFGGISDVEQTRAIGRALAEMAPEQALAQYQASQQRVGSTASSSVRLCLANSVPNFLAMSSCD